VDVIGDDVGLQDDLQERKFLVMIVYYYIYLLSAGARSRSYFLGIYLKGRQRAHVRQIAHAEEAEILVLVAEIEAFPTKHRLFAQPLPTNKSEGTIEHGR
jgi:hypothetical protein